jgi:hypothetical protein
MLTNLLSELTDFLKTALDKVFVGLLYGLGAVLGVQLAHYLLTHLLGITSSATL